jgi:hypothetical protein
VYRPALIELALRVLLLSISILLVVTACGAPEKAKPRPLPRPLPEDQQMLSQGTYRSEEFQPSFSFTIDESWTHVPLEASDQLVLAWGQKWRLGFANIQKVYEPTGTGSPSVADAPKDMVGWFQRHPYLRTDEPEQITVGGVKGVRFDVVVDDLPEDNYDMCGSDCVDIARVTGGFPPLAIWVDEKVRVIVLEKVKGETVTIGFGSPAAEFDMFAPEAQKVLDTVKWTSS